MGLLGQAPVAAALALTGLLAPLAAQDAPAPVDHARLRAPEPGQWLSVGRTYDEQRFSPLAQINDRTVGRLGLAWFADINTERGMEASPLVIDGVLYNVQPWNVVTAYDAKTGRVLWSYDPEVPLRFGRMACCDIVSRGLAAWQGKSYVSAYDAETGAQLWRWHTVPGNPADGFENPAMEMAAATWTGEWWKGGGGGTVWDNLSYDPALGLVYIGTGNGSPWAQKWRSPGGGDNLFLASIVALRADTGEYVWHYQTVPGEEWDYTATQQMILADIPLGGRTRQVLMQAPKNGFFYVLDRATGELLSAEKIAPINWASHVDMATGRPVENPAARYSTTPVMISPGAGGAHNWNPMAFSPLTGLVYVPVTETYMAYAAAESFDPARGGLGTSFTGFDAERRQIAEYADAHSRGWLSAWDPVAQREVWRGPVAQKGSGGVLATAGNLVFQGTIGTTFAAYRADTGALVWEMPVQQVPISAPIAYEVDGEQYIAVNAGWGGGLAHVERSAYTQLFLSKPRLLVYKLGGTAQLPPLPAASMVVPELSPPPALTGTPAQVALGESLYAQNCALCHGAAARGGVKDLRHMMPATHAAFLDIVLGGTRAQNGMASFADVLSREQAEAIHQYLIARARADWED